MTRKRRVVACVDLTCICATGVSQTTSSRDLLLFNQKIREIDRYFLCLDERKKSRSSLNENKGNRRVKIKARKRRKDLLLLVRLTSGLHGDNDDEDDDGIVVHTSKGFTEEKTTEEDDDDGDRNNSRTKVFVRTN